MQRSGNDFFFGFLIGFFLGCLGIAIAAMLKPDYLQGAVIGVAASIGLSCVLGGLLGVAMPFLEVADGLPSDDPNSGPIEHITFGEEPTSDLPWGLMFAALAGITIAAGGVVGALWMSQSDGDDEMDQY